MVKISSLSNVGAGFYSCSGNKDPNASQPAPQKKKNVKNKYYFDNKRKYLIGSLTQQITFLYEDKLHAFGVIIVMKKKRNK